MIAFRHLLRLVFLVALICVATAEQNESAPVPEKRENLLDIARRLMIRGTAASSSAAAAQTSSAPVAAASTSAAAAQTSAAATSAQATSEAAAASSTPAQTSAAPIIAPSSAPAAATSAAATSSPLGPASSSSAAPAAETSTVADTSVVVKTQSPSLTKPAQGDSTTTAKGSQVTSQFTFDTKTVGGVTSYVEVTQVITRVSGSSTYRYTSTSSAPTFVPTGVASLSSTASSDSKGMSSNTKAIIGGVVGGVGGAIVLGGLAIVAWRIWGRRRHDKDEGDELMGTAYGSAPTEKSDRTNLGSAGNPFQSTLESYHGPGQVNTASNF